MMERNSYRQIRPKGFLNRLIRKISGAIRLPTRKIGRFIRETIFGEKMLVSADISTFKKAQRLNNELYEPVNGIPPAELSVFTDRLVGYCFARGYSKEKTKDWMEHNLRLYLSLKEIETIVSSRHSLTILEMGGDSIVTDLIKNHFSDADLINTQDDLRSNWGIADESIDLIVSMEVLEHLTDKENGSYLDGFYRSGLKSALGEAYRVLRNGGKFFITTPNAASVNSLTKILSGDPGWVYPLHVREYTINEMTEELTNAGYEIENIETIHCMTAPTGVDYTSVFHLLTQYGYETKNRGDDIFITVVKRAKK